MATILIVEDHDMTRKVLNRRLSIKGHSILEASNGGAGIQLLKSHDIDLIIMDFMMKTMNGMQTYEKMKEIKPSVPCVMVTAYAHAGLVKQFMQQGGADFMVKPIREDFEQRIHNVLAKTTGESGEIGKAGETGETGESGEVDDGFSQYTEN